MMEKIMFLIKERMLFQANSSFFCILKTYVNYEGL